MWFRKAIDKCRRQLDNLRETKEDCYRYLVKRDNMIHLLAQKDAFWSIQCVN